MAWSAIKGGRQPVPGERERPILAVGAVIQGDGGPNPRRRSSTSCTSTSGAEAPAEPPLAGHPSSLSLDTHRTSARLRLLDTHRNSPPRNSGHPPYVCSLVGQPSAARSLDIHRDYRRHGSSLRSPCSERLFNSHLSDLYTRAAGPPLPTRAALHELTEIGRWRASRPFHGTKDSHPEERYLKPNGHCSIFVLYQDCC